MVGGDDGAFYFPYILDPNSSTAMLVGTCRVWRGSRAGGAFTALSPNFDTLGSGTCSGSEVNQVRALAAGGQTDSNGSGVIYATTGGLGPLEGSVSTPAGGRVWVTSDATAGVSAFSDVTNNGPQGSINPNQFPVSSAAVDSSDATGHTAYVTVMGFTGGTGHVWKTRTGGAVWIDFTGNLPDSPANAVVVYAALSQVFVATDVGVFASSTSSPSWTEVGSPGATSSGFLPNVAVTALGIFASGGQQLLRASTYGRGIWQFNLAAIPDFQVSMANSPLTISAGGTATFTGTAAALNGYSGTVTLSCVAGATAPPSTCSSPQSPLTPGINTSFTVDAGGAVGDYYFNVQGTGSDANHTTHLAGAELHILGVFALSETGSFPSVNAGSTTTSGPISVTASNGFTGTINLTCSLTTGSGSCSVSPSSVTSIPTTASVTANAASLSAGSYQMVVQGISGTTTHTLLIPLNVGDFQVTGPQSLTLGVGTQGAANVSVTASTYYSGNVTSTCSVSSLPGTTCTVSPSPTVVSVGSTVPLVATINTANNGAPGNYNVSVDVQDSSGIPHHSLVFPVTVQDFALSSSTSSQTVAAGRTTGPYNLTVAPVGAAFANPVTLSCSGLPSGAQCSFSPNPVTPGATSIAAILTISTASTTPAETTVVTVTGVSGALSHSGTVSLIVTNPVVSSGDFQLAVIQPFPANVDAGSQPTAKVSVTPNYSSLLNASCDASAIPGANCSVSPTSIQTTANTASTLAISVNNMPNNTSPGPYNINLTVADSSGQPSHTLQPPLTFTVIPDFTVSSTTPSQTVTAGQTTGPYQLTVGPNPQGSSFSGAVTLSCSSGLPAGAQCQFNPSAAQSPGNQGVNVVMTISTRSATANVRWSSRHHTIFYALWLLMPGIVFSRIAVRQTSGKLKPRVLGTIAALLLLMLSLLSCGGVSNGSVGGNGTGSTPVTYVIIVTGTSGSLSHSTTVNLIVD